MKKTVLILMLAIVLCTSLSAVGGYAGLSAGYDLYLYKQNVVGLELSYQDQELPIAIEGATYFGSKDNLGIGYAFYTAFPIQSTIEGQKVQIDGSITNPLGARLSFQYRLGLLDNLDLHIGAGLQFARRQQTDNGAVVQTTTWSVFLDSKVVYDIVSGFSVYGGLMLASPFSTSYKTGLAGDTLSSIDVSIFGCEIIPHLGIAFRY